MMDLQLIKARKMSEFPKILIKIYMKKMSRIYRKKNTAFSWDHKCVIVFKILQAAKGQSLKAHLRLAVSEQRNS